MSGLRDLFEQIVNARMPRRQTVRTAAGALSTTYDKAGRFVNLESYGRTGAQSPKRALALGGVDYQDGDEVLVETVEGVDLITGFVYNSTDGTHYPRVRVDKISSPEEDFSLTSGTTVLTLTDGGSPSAELTVDGTTYDLTAGAGKVKVSSNDTTADYLSEKLYGHDGVSIVEEDDGSYEYYGVTLAIQGLVRFREATTDHRFDRLNDYFLYYDASDSGAFAHPRHRRATAGEVFSAALESALVDMVSGIPMSDMTTGNLMCWM